MNLHTVTIVLPLALAAFGLCDCFVAVQRKTPPTLPVASLGRASKASSHVRWVKSMTNDRNPAVSDDPPTEENNQSSQSLLVSRRSAFQKSVSAVSVLSLLGLSSTDSAFAELKDVVGADKPVVILGGGGKVGKLCTQMLANEGIYVKCVTRSGRKVLDTDSTFVSYASADVTDYASIESVCANAYGVVFAASASGKKKGGDPAHVDYLGLYNTAKACLADKVPKLVVVSAGTVTRPDSIGFKATNAFVKFIYGDRIMDYKIAGENLVRDLYASSVGSTSTYTIVRPGGLSDKGTVGSEEVHISQGDVYSSEVTREDVAAVCIACLQCDYADNATFELNQNEGLGKAMNTLPDLPPELIHTKQPSYVALLKGLKTDSIMKQQYPDLISTFGGNGIEPVEKVV